MHSVLLLGLLLFSDVVILLAKPVDDEDNDQKHAAKVEKTWTLPAVDLTLIDKIRRNDSVHEYITNHRRVIPYLLPQEMSLKLMVTNSTIKLLQQCNFGVTIIISIGVFLITRLAWASGRKFVKNIIIKGQRRFQLKRISYVYNIA